MPISRHNSGNSRQDSDREALAVAPIIEYFHGSMLRHEASNANALRSIGGVDAQAASK